MKYRHPWELSRTKMLIGEWKRYINSLGDGRSDKIKCVNVGAGDLFFDDAYIDSDDRIEVYAVDIGYDIKDDEIITRGSKHLTRFIDNYTCYQEGSFDYSVMMDSLEYFRDDREYVTKLASAIRSGGYMFFTLPAYRKLFSAHDMHVGNLRRYDKNEADEFFSSIDGVKVVCSRYFYFSLYLARLFQVKTKARIDPDQKITTGWRHSEKSLITRTVKGLLDLDYRIGKHLPGLSLMVICKKI
ncbi:MAG: hypothetical protein ILP17_02460 [Lachnospiraceae bacterium]|nr:hypothetical protein [Lachnospiraceae bacterium]